MNEPKNGDVYLLKNVNDGRRAKAPLYFQVRVLGERDSFGRTEYLIEPVSGSGQRYVQRATLLSDDSNSDDSNSAVPAEIPVQPAIVPALKLKLKGEA